MLVCCLLLYGSFVRPLIELTEHMALSIVVASAAAGFCLPCSLGGLCGGSHTHTTHVHQITQLRGGDLTEDCITSLVLPVCVPFAASLLMLLCNVAMNSGDLRQAAVPVIRCVPGSSLVLLQ